jgi:hypothetical protein
MTRVNGMNAITDPSGRGTVTLRGIVVKLSDPVAQIFITDVCRHIEGGMDVDQLRAKYGLSDDKAYADLASNEPLQRAIAAELERRVRNGDCARERAAAIYKETPKVLADIIHDPAASNRHKVESIRELRQIAAVGPENKPDGQDRIHISINFGTAKVRLDAPMKTIKPEREPLTIEQGRDEEDDEPEYEPDF